MLQSRLFTKVLRRDPKDETALNARLLERAGFVYKNSAGVYTFLPLGWRVIQKIAQIIREEMNAIGGQELFMPALVEKKYFEATGRWDVEVGYKLESRVKSQESRVTLTVNFQVVDERYIKKSYLVDSFKKRYLDLAGHLSMIVFHPEDLDLVEGSPSLRRHHIDSLLSMVDKNYWQHLSGYNKIVVRRNKILQRIKDGLSKPLELGFWDERLLSHGQNLSKKRQELFEFLNFVESADLTSGLTPGVSLGGFSWDLKQSVLNLEKLAKDRERDIAAGVTLSGPHRDDFRFIFRDRDLAYFGSRGEQRMAVLALKLTELEYVSRQKGARPILALDDIFSELDWEHRDTVLSVIGNQQTIITAAEKESVPKEIFKKAKIIEL